jgi:hypothetical protein
MSLSFPRGPLCFIPVNRKTRNWYGKVTGVQLGHSDPQTTRRYTHATDRAKRAAVEAVRIAGDRLCHNPATAICALLHAKNHRSTVSPIDDSTFTALSRSVNAVRTSRLTRDGRSTILVSYGVSLGRLRSCASSVISKISSMPQNCRNEFWLLIHAKSAEVTSTSTSIDDGPFRTSAITLTVDP